MERKNYDLQTVGQIVADRFDTTWIFYRYGIDFCCHGDTLFIEACKKKGVDPNQVAKELDEVVEVPFVCAPAFSEWPLDLLIDYVLKIHHRNIRKEGPKIEILLDKVVKVHGAKHLYLYQVQQHFHESLIDLESHLSKEENILFPYVYELCFAGMEERKIESFHCGTIRYSIEAMEKEHSIEGERFALISSLTNGFTPPDDACSSYRLVLQQLKQFDEALHEHIHLENNIIFPKALELEQKNMK